MDSLLDEVSWHTLASLSLTMRIAAVTTFC